MPRGSFFFLIARVQVSFDCKRQPHSAFTIFYLSFPFIVFHAFLFSSRRFFSLPSDLYMWFGWWIQWEFFNQLVTMIDEAPSMSECNFGHITQRWGPELAPLRVTEAIVALPQRTASIREMKSHRLSLKPVRRYNYPLITTVEYILCWFRCFPFSLPCFH